MLKHARRWIAPILLSMVSVSALQAQGVRVDPQIDRAIQDLIVLGDNLRGETATAACNTTRTYLNTNRRILNDAVNGWRNLSQTERDNLHRAHNLNDVARQAAFYGIAISAFGWADRLGACSGSVGDRLDMLVRVLHYAKYVVDTSSRTLQMQPIEQYLPRRFAKYAVVGPLSDGRHTVSVSISGGLTNENRAEYDRIKQKFPAGSNIAEAAVLQLPHPGAPKPEVRSTYVVLMVPASSLDGVVRVLREEGFEIDQ